MAYVIYHGNGSDRNCTDVDHLMKRYYLPVMYSLIFIVGLVGNITSLLVYFAKLRPWKSSSVIMVNLASTDLLYAFSMPFLVYYYTRGDSWNLGGFMCLFVRFGFHFNLQALRSCISQRPLGVLPVLALCPLLQFFV